MTEGRRRVATGLGLTSPIGNRLSDVVTALRTSTHGIRVMDAWNGYQNLSTRLAALAVPSDKKFSRKRTRTMGRVGQLALMATEDAVEMARLSREEMNAGRVGLAFGSTHGSSSAQEVFCRKIFAENGFKGVAGSAYLQFMSHTCAANLAQDFGIRGRVIPVISACASASQSIGYGYEAIRDGIQDVMICGGRKRCTSFTPGFLTFFLRPPVNTTMHRT